MSFYLLNIIQWLESHQLPCLFKSVTHFDCPGCGIQRSFILLAKGEISNSFVTYPALVPIMLLGILLLLHLVLKFRNGATILKCAYLFCAGIILVSYIYKLVITKTI
jgi:hypothetical protein